MRADVDARPQKVVYSYSWFPSVGLVVAHGDDFVLAIAGRAPGPRAAATAVWMRGRATDLSRCSSSRRRCAPGAVRGILVIMPTPYAIAAASALRLRPDTAAPDSSLRRPPSKWYNSLYDSGPRADSRKNP